MLHEIYITMFILYTRIHYIIICTRLYTLGRVLYCYSPVVYIAPLLQLGHNIIIYIYILHTRVILL